MAEDNEQPRVYKPGTFRPGQSGNPNGRPKAEFSITEQLRKRVAEDPSALLDPLCAAYKRGEPWAIQYTMDRIDGKPRQMLDTGNSGGDPLFFSLQMALLQRMGGALPEQDLETGVSVPVIDAEHQVAPAPPRSSRGRPRGSVDRMPRKPRTERQR